MLQNQAAAEDMVSDTFLALIENIDQVSVHENPMKWLFTVLRNRTLNEIRKTQKHKECSLEEAFSASIEMGFDLFSHLLPNGLTTEERQLLCLRYEKDWEYAQIASLWNITESACRMRMSRAKKHCAELLQQQQRGEKASNEQK